MKIAILNTDPDVMDILRDLLIEKGHDAISKDIFKLKRESYDVISFLEYYKPDTVLFDIPPPHIENWNYLKLLRRAFPNMNFVVMTTSRRALENSIGPISDRVLNIIVKPFDLEQIVSVISQKP